MVLLFHLTLEATREAQFLHARIDYFFQTRVEMISLSPQTTENAKALCRRWRKSGNPARLCRGRKRKLIESRAGYSKRPSDEAAGELKPEAYPLRYVEDFDELRTKLGDFFSSLLDVEAEVDYIRFLNDVVFAFEAKQPLFLHLHF
jgi:hypothetical protein